MENSLVWQRLKRKGIWLADLFTNRQLRTGFLQALPFWIASLLVGLIAVGYARLFNFAEQQIQAVYHWNKQALFILTPAFFVLAWWLVHRFAPNAKGSGIPQVMAAIELSTPKHDKKVNHLLGLRIVIVKIFSSLFMVLGGGAIGREGPTIQIAGSVFHLFRKLIPASWPKLSDQSYILTGAAAGLAAAFNTPLGGMVFAMEELARIHIRFFRTALFSAVIIAGLTAEGLLGPYLYLGYPKVSPLPFSMFFGVAGTAALAGLAGSLMSRVILKLLTWRSRIKDPRRIVLFLVVTGLIVSTITCFWNAEVMGSGKELMTTQLFTSDKGTSWDTALLRLVGPILSFGTGAAGGIFAPALAAGAAIGAFLAELFHMQGPAANILILGGMVGLLTGVTRTPFTSAILVLEMTDRHSVIFHLMLAAMIAYLASLLIDKHSLYDHLKKQYVADVLKSHEQPPVN